MKVFAARFHTAWNGETISYSAKSMALRVGNDQVDIDQDDLSDLENAQSTDVTVPVRIYKKRKAEARGE